MKVPFKLGVEKHKMLFRLTRDSVCMGDDCDAPHEKTLENFSFTDVESFIDVVAKGYLPSVAGIGHTWDCLLNGIHVGTVSHYGIKTRVTQITYLEENLVHFKYNSATY